MWMYVYSDVGSERMCVYMCLYGLDTEVHVY